MESHTIAWNELAQNRTTCRAELHDRSHGIAFNRRESHNIARNELAQKRTESYDKSHGIARYASWNCTESHDMSLLSDARCIPQMMMFSVIVDVAIMSLFIGCYRLLLLMVLVWL